MFNSDYLTKEELEEIITKKINPDDISRILGAYEMAETSQLNQIAPDGSPNFYHTTRVCKLLLKELEIFEPDLIITSLLHNILTNRSEITLNIVEYNFGSYVAYLTQLVHDDYYQRTGQSSQRKLISKIDQSAMIIILADCLDTVRTLDFGTMINPFQYMNDINVRYFSIAAGMNNETIDKLIKLLQIEYNKLIG